MHNSDVEGTGDTVDGRTCNDSESTEHPLLVTADSSGNEPTSEATDCQNTERHCELERETDVDAEPEDSCEPILESKVETELNLAP